MTISASWRLGVVALSVGALLAAASLACKGERTATVQGPPLLLPPADAAPAPDAPPNGADGSR